MTILTLDITGPEGQRLGDASRKVVRAAGGTIGRVASADWVLKDPYVSPHHAIIRYADGVFSIEDTSTNGTFLNSQDNRLVKGQPYVLKSGDWIFIEPYEIRASIAGGPEHPRSSPFADLFSFSDPVPSAAASDDASWAEMLPVDATTPDSSGSPDPLPADVDPLELLGFAPARPPEVAPTAATRPVPGGEPVE